jgi:hypothetical protein
VTSGTRIGRLGCLALVMSMPVLALAQSGSGTLAARPGEHGVWIPPNAGDERLVELDSANPGSVNPFAIETNPLQRTPRADSPPTTPQSFTKLTLSEVPFQPWAKALYAYRQENQLEPHTRCKPSGGPRQFLTPYGVEFLEPVDLTRVIVIDIGGPHSMRTIYTDGRAHPKDLEPTALGHSIGHWDNGTLVVDTVGFNERFWIDRWGLPHTQRLHLTERFTRLDPATLKYEITVDDPGAYTASWTTGLLLRWNPNQELFEYVCQDNNLAPQLMLGAANAIDRSSVIVP